MGCFNPKLLSIQKLQIRSVTIWLAVTTFSTHEWVSQVAATSSAASRGSGWLGMVRGRWHSLVDMDYHKSVELVGLQSRAVRG